MAFADLLQHSVTLQRLSTTKDSSGGTINAYTTVTSFNCLIRGASSNEINAHAQQNIQVSHVIATLYSSVTPGDRLIDASSLYYEVKGVKHQRGVGTIGEFWEITANQLKQ